MKSLITIMTVIMLSFAVTAFADDPADMNTRDTGTLIYEASLMKMPIEREAKLSVEAKPADVGVALYEEFLAHERELAESGAWGVAAGGTGAVREVDETARIWESTFGPGGSDLP